MKLTMILFIGICLFFTLPVEVHPQNSGTTRLPDLVKPRYMAVDSRSVYIVDSYIHVTGFSIDKLEKNFEIKARKGQGPAEFVNVPMIVSSGPNIILKTTEKIAYYSDKGKYLSEKKLKKEGVIEPLGNNYLFWYFGFIKNGKKLDMFTFADILDKNLVKIKNIYKYKAPQMNYIISGGDGSRKGKLDLIRQNFSITTWLDKVFIADPSRGFYIMICDQSGKTINEISINTPPVKITDKDREILIKKKKSEWSGSDESWKMVLKTNDLYAPEFFPPFEKIAVANDKIYVKTFQSQDDKTLFIILDLKGKELNRVYLPQSGHWAIGNNRYYFLSFIDDDDEWSLNWTTIEI